MNVHGYNVGMCYTFPGSFSLLCLRQKGDWKMQEKLIKRYRLPCHVVCGQSRVTFTRSIVIEDRIQQVLDLYVNHHRSVRDIQREIGVSPTETDRILDKAGIREKKCLT